MQQIKINNIIKHRYSTLKKTNSEIQKPWKHN